MPVEEPLTVVVESSDFDDQRPIGHMLKQKALPPSPHPKSTRINDLKITQTKTKKLPTKKQMNHFIKNHLRHLPKFLTHHTTFISHFHSRFSSTIGWTLQPPLAAAAPATLFSFIAFQCILVWLQSLSRSGRL
ncbi:hypothetical protein RJT34_17373 [Clitoria ternatea]|uniref:Uncharacterized protein n=1 Tax=Clitoria ternatea TaxID=43366 RepID=A0AAN9PEH6_CLITE